MRPWLTSESDIGLFKPTSHREKIPLTVVDEMRATALLEAVDQSSK
jgi:hypothetical protein